MTTYPDIRFKKVEGVGYDLFELTEDCFVPSIQTIIPKGQTTDFASIPRILWTFIPPYGRSTNPSIPHDFLYEKSKTMSRIEVDKLFLVDLIRANVPIWQCVLMYTAVRWFGEKAWRKHRF